MRGDEDDGDRDGGAGELALESRPLKRGKRTSRTRHPGASGRGLARNSCAFERSSPAGHRGEEVRGGFPHRPIVVDHEDYGSSSLMPSSLPLEAPWFFPLASTTPPPAR